LRHVSLHDALPISVLSKRLRLSNNEAAQLDGWAQAPAPQPDMAEDAFRRLLYREAVKGLEWRLKLALVSARTRAVEDTSALIQAAGCQRLLKIAGSWEKPKFPVSGKDLLALGDEPGEAVGKTLNRLEEMWVEANFELEREALLAEVAEGRS